MSTTSAVLARMAAPRGRSWAVALGALALAFLLTNLVDAAGTDYAYIAAYTVLQFVVLATAWNILGGYAGYVNFGSAAFFAVGIYTTVAAGKAFGLGVVGALPLAALAAGVLGLLTGYLTLRLRGVFFSIATLALSVVLHTLVVNWDYVGGARGAYVMRVPVLEGEGSYARFLFLLMLAMAGGSVLLARAIEHSWLGRGLAAIRDDETAAEGCGVPALRLKLIATTISGALMGLAGAPFAHLVTYVEPNSAFGLAIAVNAIAMPLIGGVGTWWGPVIGALLLGTAQQVASVTISSAANLLLVGLLLVVFVAAAPRGIAGILADRRARRLTK